MTLEHNFFVNFTESLIFHAFYLSFIHLRTCYFPRLLTIKPKNPEINVNIHKTTKFRSSATNKPTWKVCYCHEEPQLNRIKCVSLDTKVPNCVYKCTLFHYFPQKLCKNLIIFTPINSLFTRFVSNNTSDVCLTYDFDIFFERIWQP